MSDRKAVIKAWSSQYRKTSKKEKGRILDELVALTEYNRWYVVGLLRWDGKETFADVCTPITSATEYRDGAMQS
jgi:hypothetical protein